MSEKRERHPTQCQRLMQYFVLHKKITPLDAWSKLGIYRLSGWIYDLKEMGVGITTTKTDVVNAFGEKCSVALYELTSVPDGMIEFE